MINIVDMANYLENDLDEVLGNGVSVLKFYRSTCQPCKEVSDELNQLFFDDRADATIYNVNVSDCPEVAGEFSIFRKITRTSSKTTKCSTSSKSSPR